MRHTRALSLTPYYMGVFVGYHDRKRCRLFCVFKRKQTIRLNTVIFTYGTFFSYIIDNTYNSWNFLWVPETRLLRPAHNIPIYRYLVYGVYKTPRRTTTVKCIYIYMYVFRCTYYCIIWYYIGYRISHYDIILSAINLTLRDNRELISGWVKFSYKSTVGNIHRYYIRAGPFRSTKLYRRCPLFVRKHSWKVGGY